MFAVGPALLTGNTGAGSGGAFNPLWSNVTLALHADDIDGSTTFTDEKGHTLTRVGSNTISTAQSKFGGSSIYFPGDGGIYASTGGTNPDFAFAGDFMVRLWVYLTGATGTARAIYDGRRNPGSAEGFILYTDTSNFLKLYSGIAFYLQDSVALPTNQWVHLAISRASGTLRSFKDGVQMSSGTPAVNLSDGRLWLGQTSTEYGSGGAWEGYMDDIEVVNGEAVYTASFIPPTAPFPNS